MTAGIAQLLGTDSTVFGEVAAMPADRRAGVAMSRGRFPKAGAWVDPNEDAVLVAADDDRWLLMAADGHLGFDAARAAAVAVRRNAMDVLADDRHGQLVVRDVFERARQEVAEALSACDQSRARSRTTLSIALVRPGEVFSATCGDSTIFCTRDRRVRTLTTPSPFFGPRTPTPHVCRTRLRPGDGLAAVTDGFTDFLGPSAAATVARELAGPTPDRAAHALVFAALAAGAGDNVSAAVLLPDPAHVRAGIGRRSRLT